MLLTYRLVVPHSAAVEMARLVTAENDKKTSSPSALVLRCRAQERRCFDSAEADSIMIGSRSGRSGASLRGPGRGRTAST
jgi:hypothetical protein